MKRLFVLWMVMMTAGSRADAGPPAILVFGDSISAGFGLETVDRGWVEMLRAKLKGAGYETAVINASVSGETTAGGLARLPRALTLHHPQTVILELGGNDGLRALPIDQMRSNLIAMIDLAVHAGARVLLLGMRLPPNYGPEYTAKFHSVFAEVAKQKNVAWVPFLLDGIALAPALMQADGVHPNELGQPLLLANVWPVLQPMLRR